MGEYFLESLVSEGKKVDFETTGGVGYDFRRRGRQPQMCSTPRTLDNATEPRKRLKSLPDTSRQGSNLSHSESTATPAGTVHPRPHPDSRSEMQNSSQSVTLQLQHVQNQ